jgi:hypothetical protein
MGAQVFPIPSCPMSPNIAKKPFSVTYLTSDICQLPYFALISALNLDSSELRFAQIFLELLSIVSGHKHEVLLHVFHLVATNKILDQTNVTFSTVNVDTCNLLYKVLESVTGLIGFSSFPLLHLPFGNICHFYKKPALLTNQITQLCQHKKTGRSGFSILNRSGTSESRS